MKSISAAIVIVAGLQTVVTSALFIKHDGTQIFVSGLGVVVALVGVVGWVWAMRSSP